MKPILSDHDRSELDRRIAETEKRTNCQIVLSIIGRCDVYEELPWKAFALGASLAGLAAIVINTVVPLWYTRSATLVAILATLAGGALLALLTVLFPGFAKYFLTSSQAEEEIRQYAQALFLERELFATRGRTGILVLVSLFERRVVILPDTGLAHQLPEKTLHDIIGSMTPFLKKGDIRKAFETVLEHLSRTIRAAGSGTGRDALPNALIEEEGV